MKTGFVQLAAFLDLALTLFHIGFWRLFRWPETLQPSGRLNTAVTQVMNIMLTFVFGTVAATLFWMGAATPAALLFAAAAFGALRTILQPIFFGLGSRASQGFTAAMILLTLAHFGAALA
ncbi:MAG: hypothetical protein IOC64_11225 [Methylobacterium sp.]|nr:hypothetical protein [Methylobacterium sp.]MCA3598675.1 hypothetical protein [Methylobacterium sp.]MCA3601711.1 hypothetical protein [Methylobacterium sp.]MCA3606340.1 hypothetical protein [Methylobacterium sp.]MCA3609126.1 hypothetical protein [Methylobacterium sp.]